jgi:hypothetical protein
MMLEAGTDILIQADRNRWFEDPDAALSFRSFSNQTTNNNKR